MIFCIPDLLPFTDISFVDKLSLIAVSFLIHTSLLFSFFVTYFWGFLFQSRVWGMKFCYWTCEITFGLMFRKRKWPKVGLILEEWHSMGSGGIQCRGPVQLLSFMSFEFELLYSSFFICKWCLRVYSVGPETCVMYVNHLAQYETSFGTLNEWQLLQRWFWPRMVTNFHHIILFPG
jgi:hypothetical protein